MNYKIILLILVCLSINVIADSVTLRPNGQGSFADWKTLGCYVKDSKELWKCVDENPAQVDLLTSMKKDAKVSFAFEDVNLQSNETINNVTLYYLAKSSMSGSVRALFKGANGKHLGNNKKLLKNFTLYNEAYSTNPSTNLPWTINEVNNFEAGFEQYHSNSWTTPGQVMLNQVYAVVDYTVPPKPDSCSDTDGDNISVLGSVSGYFNNVVYSDNDQCSDSSTVLEYACNDTQKVSQEYTCGTDNYTSDNYCYEASNNTIMGDVYRDYIDYYCSDGKCSANTSRVLQEDCSADQECIDAQCLYKDSCSDSDNGDSFSAGTVSGYFNRTNYSFNDYCTADWLHVVEYSCNGTVRTNETILCGVSGYVTGPYCLNNIIWANYTLYQCYPDTCIVNTSAVFWQNCTSTGKTCTNGTCV